MKANTANAVILIVASMLAWSPTMGLPAANRRTLADTTSPQQHRDALIAGSDFLNMFMGATSRPAVRGRRFPVVQSAGEPRHRQYFERRQNRDRDVENFTENLQDPRQKLSGLISSQDRSSAVRRQFGKTARREGDGKFANSAKGFGEVNGGDFATGDKKVVAVISSESSVFGERTVPRTVNADGVSTSTSSSALPVVDSTSSGSPNEVASSINNNNSDIKMDESIVDRPADVVEATQKQLNAHNANIKSPETSRFSVSSTVHIVTSKRVKKYPSNPVTDSNEISSTSLLETDDDRSTEKIETTASPDMESTTQGTLPTTTESLVYSTVDEETSTNSMFVDLDEATEENEDWSTKTTDVTSVASDIEKKTSASVPESIVSIRQKVSPVRVVSVRVSSSVIQAPAVAQSSRQTNTVSSTVSEIPAPVEDAPQSGNVESTETPTKNEVNLVIEDLPQATSIQRSDFSVEEAAPSEVTADPQVAYSSFHPYKYRPTSEETSSQPQVVSQSYKSGGLDNRAQNFGKYTRYNRRGPPSGAQRRAVAESSVINASVVESNRRSYVAHALPRVSYQRNSQSIAKEPVSVAESIQRSVIANQDVDRSQYRQDKVDDQADAEDQRSKNEFGRGKKSFQVDDAIPNSYDQSAKVYSEPARVYGEPAKMYSEPAKIYSEPAKNYGEPAKIYSEPAKIYSEPAKIYSEPAKIYGEPAKVYSEPAKVYGEPSKVYSEPAKNYGVAEQNYEVDEKVSVSTNGRVHGVQPETSTEAPADDTAMEQFDSRDHDPNHKFGYVVEGRDFRKYRVEERTSDGFIVGEYAVVSNDGGNLRGVRYIADGTINPKLIYDTLVKFLSL